jgi:hypothetical protein
MLHVNFLKENNHLEVDVQMFLKKFILESPFRRPDSIGDGVCLSVDTPYNEKNACVNINRPGYVRNNYGKTDNRMKPSHNGNMHRFTYGTGSGAITHGIAMRYVFLFIFAYTVLCVLIYLTNYQTVNALLVISQKNSTEFLMVFMSMFLVFTRTRKMW